MLFNSVTFLLFFFSIATISWMLPRTLRLYLLFSSSLVFYGFWRIEFIFLMIASAILDYSLALKISHSKEQRVKKILLIISILFNIGVLVLFKYLLFFAENFVGLLSLIGLDLKIDPFFFNIILPLGISFYTFQTISYTVDVYRGFIKPEREFVLFATYVTFFPQLVAGPILRAREVIPQLKTKPLFKIQDLKVGLRRIIFGLFLKVVLADNIAPLVDIGFSSEASLLSAIDVWTLSFLFGFQIYFDFAAYSFIAIGCARVMGMTFPENFNFPYSSDSPKEFWKRWHISLSSWIRDYLYLPLTGAKVQDRSVGGITPVPSDSTSYALFSTWALMGLWHGASWTFVFWGVYHAILIYIHRLISPFIQKSIFYKINLGVIFTLPFMMLGWVSFRAEDLDTTFVLLSKVLNFNQYFLLGLRENNYIVAFLVTFGALIAKPLYEYFINLENRNLTKFLIAETVIYCFTVPLIFVFLRPITQFIYFQF